MTTTDTPNIHNNEKPDRVTAAMNEQDEARSTYINCVRQFFENYDYAIRTLADEKEDIEESLDHIGKLGHRMDKANQNLLKAAAGK